MWGPIVSVLVTNPRTYGLGDPRESSCHALGQQTATQPVKSVFFDGNGLENDVFGDKNDIENEW